MLDALKDLYISYPFMPVESAPEFFAHIKDIRCVVELDAGNPISLVENDNYIRAWLTGLTNNQAIVKIECDQYGVHSIMHIPVYRASVGAPATNSYVLVDDDLVVPTNQDMEYELQPDTLLFMQLAPVIRITNMNDESGVLMGPTIETAHGQNVSITKGQNGIIIYGAPGAGLGVYTTYPACYSVPLYLRGDGAISINGLSGYVRIDEAYPVAIIGGTSSTDLQLVIKNGEVQ